MTSVAHNRRDELRAVIPNAIAHSGDTFNKINGITEEAAVNMRYSEKLILYMNRIFIYNRSTFF